jgi:hypothetical protein
MARVETIVFLSLVLDLFAFTVPLPLFPRLIEWYTVVSEIWRQRVRSHTSVTERKLRSNGPPAPHSAIRYCDKNLTLQVRRPISALGCHTFGWSHGLCLFVRYLPTAVCKEHNIPLGHSNSLCLQGLGHSLTSMVGNAFSSLR